MFITVSVDPNLATFHLIGGFLVTTSRFQREGSCVISIVQLPRLPGTSSSLIVILRRRKKKQEHPTEICATTKEEAGASYGDGTNPFQTIDDERTCRSGASNRFASSISSQHPQFGAVQCQRRLSSTSDFNRFLLLAFNNERGK
jgi:hypothetical protein